MSDPVKVQGNHLGATPQQAYDEAMRELQVRERCFPRWVQDGKLSRTDARARLDAQARICAILAEAEGVLTADPTEKEIPF